MENDEQFHKKELDGIGGAFVAYRAAQSLTQKALAKQAAVNRNSISKIERGEVYTSLYVLFKLTDFFGISPLILFYESSYEMRKELFAKHHRELIRSLAKHYLAALLEYVVEHHRKELLRLLNRKG